MTTTPDLPAIGDLAVGRYRIVRELGRGGYGVVYHARQEAIDRDVAIKFLLPEVASDPTEVERFRREVFNASGLEHPHTITLYDYGKSPAGLFYVVMEYLDGRTLRQELGRRGAFSPVETRILAEQLLGSLDEAHRRQLVHRDLKPENIFLINVDRGEIESRILDFGLSKFVGDPHSTLYRGPSLTAEGEICGTPQYMSPEHAYGEDVNPPGDLYSLGLVLYEVLVGRPAFDGPSPLDILLKQVKHPLPEFPEPLRNTSLARFIRQATEKDAKDRFEDAGAALQWLYRHPSDGPAELPHQKPTRILKSAPLDTVKDQTLAPPQAPDGVEPTPAVEATVEVPTLTSRHFALERFELRLAQMPLLGRRPSLAQLDAWLSTAQRTGGLFAITGDAGSGKTTLLDHWLDQLRTHHGITVLRGSHTRKSPMLSGIIEAFEPLLNKQPTEDTSPLSAERVQLLGRVFSETRSHDAQPEQVSSAAIALSEALKDLARSEPILLILEDLQHADPVTIRLVEHLLTGLATSPGPLAMVVTARQSRTLKPFQDSPAANLFTHWKLPPLSEAHAGELLHRIFPCSTALSTGLLKLASGNPALLIHLCRFLLESKRVSLDEENGIWYLEDPSTPIEELVPLDLQQLVIQRADRYLRSSPDETALRSILHRVVLLGDRFDASLLKTCLRQERMTDLERNADELLKKLATSGLIRCLDPNTRTYAFARPLHRASLVRMVESIDDWRAFHGWVADEQIARFQQGHPLATPAMIAEHLERAQRTTETMTWWLKAADRAETELRFRQALQFLRRAETHLHASREVDPHLAGALRLQQGRLCRRVGEFGPAEDALREAIDHSHRSDDTEVRAHSLEILADVVLKQGRLDEAADLLEEVGSIYHVLLDVEGKRRIRLARADLATYRGQYGQARRLFQGLRTDLRETGNTPADVRCLLGLARCAYAGGDLLQSRDFADEALVLADQTHDFRAAASALIEAAHAALFTEGIEAAESLAHQALTLARREEDRLAEANAHLALGLTLRRSTHMDRAAFHASRARELHESLGHIYGVLKSVLLQAELAWLHGDVRKALLLAEDTTRLHTELGDRHGWALSTLFQALFTIELRRPSEARELIHDVLKMESEDGLGLYEPLGLFYLGLTYAADHQIEDALESFGESLAMAQRMGHRELTSLTAINLVRLQLTMGDVETARQELPIALQQAQILGHAYCNMFALIGSALLAHIDHDPARLEEYMRRLRTYINTPNSPEMRLPGRLREMRRLVDLHPLNPRRQAVADAIDDLHDSLQRDTQG